MPLPGKVEGRTTRIPLGADRERLDEERARTEIYLEAVAEPMRARGLGVRTLALISHQPAHAILEYAVEDGTDLIAMATHGHRGVSDVLHGQTVDHVRHKVTMPVLLLRARRRRLRRE